MRDAFLLAVAHALQQESGPVGPGTIARVCRELHRQFFDPPQLDETRGVSRWARHAPRFDKVSKRAC